MRQLAFGLLLAATPVWADWQLVDTTESMFVYADNATVRKRGNTVKIWVLYDRKKPHKLSNGRDHKSFIVQKEFDCAEEQGRTLASAHYSEAFGQGDVLGSTNTPNASWEPMVPQSLGMALFQLACEAN